FVGGHGTFHATRQGKPWPASIKEGASGTHPDCVCRRKGQAGCTPQRACGLTVRSTRTAPPPLNSSVRRLLVLVLRAVCFAQLHGNLQCFGVATFFRHVAASLQPSELVVLG